MNEVARAVLTEQADGRIKVFVDDHNRILGASILAANGGELLAPLLLAMQAGLPLCRLGEVVWPYPTLSTVWDKMQRS